MTYAQLRAKFPHASESFLRANSTGGVEEDPKPQRTVQHEPVEPKTGAGEHSKRFVVRITACRQRLLDPDNLCPKYFIDGLRYAGLIPDDTPDQIELEVRQEKVTLQSDECTVIDLYQRYL